MTFFSSVGLELTRNPAGLQAIGMPCCAAVGGSMRNEPYHPLAGLAIVLIVGIGFWSGVVLLAEKFL